VSIRPLSPLSLYLLSPSLSFLVSYLYPFFLLFQSWSNEHINRSPRVGSVPGGSGSYTPVGSVGSILPGSLGSTRVSSPFGMGMGLVLGTGLALGPQSSPSFEGLNTSDSLPLPLSPSVRPPLFDSRPPLLGEVGEELSSGYNSGSSQPSLGEGSGGGGRNQDRGHKKLEDVQNQIHLENIQSGTDKRTSLMIRNIPNKYSQTELLAAVNEHNEGKYDFFYLPIDFNVSRVWLLSYSASSRLTLLVLLMLLRIIATTDTRSSILLTRWTS
jgi:hypothetical protein